MANGKTASLVTVTLRKDRRFKTWIARIVGANTAADQSKNGRTYDLKMDFIDSVKSGSNWVEFNVPDGAFYMLAQPNSDFSGREVKRVLIRNGQSQEVDESTVRAAFKLAPKAERNAATPTAGALAL